VCVGLLSIASGILYTAGPFPLAYIGASELFVVVFFGPVAVLGTYYVQALQFSSFAFWAGLVPGLLSTGLLAVNNLRDRNQDVKANKKTLAVRFGERFARLEYSLVVLAAALVLLVLCVLNPHRPGLLAPMLALSLAWPLCRLVYVSNDAQTFNQVLASTGKLVLLLGVTFSVGYLI
jgi:1,4-dihydroxy-2-naphthoate octaprenyltransferase